MKKGLTVLLSVAMFIMLAACGNKVEEGDKYISMATEIVSLLNEGKYADVHAKFDQNMKIGLPVEKMSELTPILEQSGTFQKISKSSAEEKDGYIIVVLLATYSESNRIYTITFNQQDEVAGLFIQ